METVFITSGLLIAILFFTANYLVKGIGGMSAPLQQVGMFLLNKAPAGIIDLFSDEAGSGSKTWIRFGMVWFIFANFNSFQINSSPLKLFCVYLKPTFMNHNSFILFSIVHYKMVLVI